MRIENPDNIDYNDLREMGIRRDKIELHTLHGLDQMTGVDKFTEWVETLNLPPFRRLCPLAQNWPHDRPYLINWLGRELFDAHFHPHYRDLIPMCQFINDLHFTKGGDVWFRRVDLTTLCSHFGIERLAKHEALNDAAATAEIYRRALNRYTPGFYES